MTDTPRVVLDLAELVRLANLSDVSTYEVSGRRTQPDDAGKDAEPQESPDLEVAVRHEGARLEVRLRVSAEVMGGAYTADVAGTFDLTEPVEIEDEVMRQFVGRVAVMVIYPFVREAIYSLAIRLRLEIPLLGLLHAENVDMTRSEDAAPEPE